MIPDVRIELLDGVGHTPMLEDPQTTARLLSDFMADVADRNREASFNTAAAPSMVESHRRGAARTSRARDRGRPDEIEQVAFQRRNATVPGVHRSEGKGT